MSQHQRGPGQRRHDAARRRWLPLAAAAAVLTVGGAAYVATQVGDDAEPGTTGTSAPVELALPSGQVSRCMAFDAQALAAAETAFAGTVRSAEGDTVVLEVERWYAGGSADEVRLAVPATADLAMPLPGQPEFTAGERWLVSATDGRVAGCGFTAPWSAERAEVFEDAFTG